MPAELLNLKQTAEIIGKHPKSFRRWQRSHKGERFTRVVRELELINSIVVILNDI
ncbi:hypothetical protein WS105_0656 [Weissella ceti]|uniref:hypothetical protein n=1 Tax=Weissella ceti TaxID=759620 RepID=UPI0004F7CDF0|nr:hypothetical protein [Weissella ceti]AIM64246.1 hypothetical protein WS105_0656 [Weissella ceti]